MRPGVVSLPHGWGHSRRARGCAVAAGAARRQHQRPRPTSSAVDALCGTAAFSGVAVEVVAVPASTASLAAHGVERVSG